MENLMSYYNKYKNVRTMVDGIYFDSKKEAGRYQQLKLLEKAGLIKDLELQVPFILIDKSKLEREYGMRGEVQR